MFSKDSLCMGRGERDVMVTTPYAWAEGSGIIPSKGRWEKKQRARLRSVAFTGKNSSNVDNAKVSK